MVVAAHKCRYRSMSKGWAESHDAVDVGYFRAVVYGAETVLHMERSCLAASFSIHSLIGLELDVLQTIEHDIAPAGSWVKALAIAVCKAL